MASAARAVTAATAGALLLAALAGCGDQTAASSAKTQSAGTQSATTQPADFDVTTATLTDQPFCDTIDPAEVAPLLGLSADRVRLQVDRKVGDKVEGPVEEQGLKTSDVNMCIFGTSTKQFIVTVQPTSTADNVTKTIKDLRALSGKGSSEDCAVTRAPAFGTPAATADCHGTLGSTRFVGVATGLVGGSKFFCSLILNQSKQGSDPQQSLVDTCGTVLQSLAA
ncbi:MAG: hypothetical protein QOK15_3185 [Nocardioidaceae bacterium]|jgi:hypothetical protein|nr:hypothetical protein [Nocardioidaceae bacterium]